MPRTQEVSIFSISLGALLCLLYHHPFVHNFWLFDDPFILRYAAEHPAWAYLFDPQVWNLFSSANFTPMVVLSYALDYHLFGLSPKWFYLHSLLSLWVLCILIYLLLRRHIPIWAALFGVLFFILSKPFTTATEILMLRHYIEGAVFSSLAALFFLSALKNDSMPKAAWAAFFYLLAMLCKEIYIPLPLILCFVPQCLFRQRIKMCLLISLSLILYLGWRLWMLGVLIGGYSGELMADGFQSRLSTFFCVLSYLGSSVAEYSGYAQFIAACLGFLITVSLAYHISRRNFCTLAFGLAGLVAAIVPLLPIVPHLQDNVLIAFRFSFAAVLVLSINLALAAADITKIQAFRNLSAHRYIDQLLSLVTYVLLTAIIIVTCIQSIQWLSQQRMHVTEPLSIEGRFIWQKNQPGIMVRSEKLTSTSYYQSLNYLKMEIAGREPLLVIADGYGLLSNVNDHTAGEPKFFSYSRETQEVSEVSSQVKKRRNQMLSSIGDSQFHAHLEVDQGHFAMNLETTKEQTRLFMLLGYLPRMYSDAFVFSGQRDVHFDYTLFAGLTGYFRFGQHDLSEDTISLSPQWWLDLSQTRKITWPKDGGETQHPMSE